MASSYIQVFPSPSISKVSILKLKECIDGAKTKEQGWQEGNEEG